MSELDKAKEEQRRILQLYSPHQAQLKFHNDPARFRVVAWGRQSGKSTGTNNDILKFAWTRPNSICWFISPTYAQAETQYRRLSGMLYPCRGVIAKNTSNNMRIILTNNSEIQYKSGDAPDNLLGDSLHYAALDEMKLQDKNTWPMYIRPMLTTTNGHAVFASTPNGFDHFYDLACRAQADTTGKWSFMSAPSTANPLFTQEEFESAKRDMSEDMFAQEILAEFRNLHSGKAYIKYTSKNESNSSPICRNPTTNPLVDKYLPIVLGADFNVNPMSWVVGQFRIRQSYWFKEIYVRNTDTTECAKEFARFVLELRAGGHKSEPAVLIAGDSSGGNRSTKSAGETDYSIIHAVLKANGITYEDHTPEANPSVRDRVNNVNAVCQSASGEINFWLNPQKCPNLKIDMDRTTWKEGLSATLDKSDPDRTHLSDAIGYPISVFAPIPDMLDVGTLSVIHNRA